MDYFSGIKSLAIFLVFSAHVHHFRLEFPHKNGESLLELKTCILYQSIQFGSSVLEFFFIAGGILSAKKLRHGFRDR